MRSDSTHLDRTADALTEGINGHLLTRRSVESTMADMSSLRGCTNPDVQNETEKRNPKKKTTPQTIICILYLQLHLSVPGPLSAHQQPAFLYLCGLNLTGYFCLPIYLLACYSSTFGHPGLLASCKDEHS